MLEASISTDGKAGARKGQGQDVLVSSDTYDTLRNGVLKALQHAETLKASWEKKVAQAETVVMCKTCGKKFKSVAGVKRHWKAKKNDCTSELGYEEVPDIEASVDDRLTPEQKRMQELREKSNAAARQVVGDLSGNKIPDDKIPTAEALYNAHLSKLTGMLKAATDEVIQEFLTMRFDINNCTKQHLALKELKRRQG